MESYRFDLERIFWGDTSPMYLFEIIFRTCILFIYTLLILRFLGHRGLSNLSLFEFGIIIALGSAVGDPMFYPDIPLIHGMTVITIVVIFQRLLVQWTIHNRKVEAMVEGRPIRLVKDGILDRQGIRMARLSREEIYTELRQEGAQQLGQIRRAYLEIDGEFSVFLFSGSEVRPGLPLMPREEREVLILEQGDTVSESGIYACYHCGITHYFETSEVISNCLDCKHTRWVRASSECVPDPT